jgi:hypothetical protein
LTIATTTTTTTTTTITTTTTTHTTTSTTYFVLLFVYVLLLCLLLFFVIPPTRIVSRPWQSDELFGEILEKAIRGPLSPCTLIHNSAELQTWFASFCKEEGVNCGDARNLRAAKHRFESYATPLARVCRHFSPSPSRGDQDCAHKN